MRVKLADAVMENREVEVRPALYAKKCDACGRIFHMRPYCNDRHLAELRGTFDKVDAVLGNVFLADICSLACGHELFANGGWRKLDAYKTFATMDATLVRVELCVTSMVLDEKAARERHLGTRIETITSMRVVED